MHAKFADWSCQPASAGARGFAPVLPWRQIIGTGIVSLVALAAPMAAGAQDIALSPDVIATGKLSIANTVDYAPFGYLEDDGKPAGIVIELAMAMADLLDVDLDIQRTPFPAIMPGMASGRFRIAWESFLITPERLEHVDFVVFLKGGIAASTRPDLLDRFAGEWGLCGKHIGVSAGSASDFLLDRLDADCRANGAEAIEKSVFSTSQDIVQAVLSGRLDARFDDATASSYFETVSNGQLVVTPGLYEVAPLGMAIAKNDPATAQMIVSALAVLFDNGTYAEVLGRYGMASHAVAEPYFVDSLDDLRAE